MRSFQSALRKGQDAERAWVDQLRSLGRSVSHGLKLRVKTHDKQTGHVECPDAVGLFSIEIKERNLDFNDPESWPYDTVYVDDLRGMGMERLRHIAYVYISQKTGDWVWLCTLDRDKSWKETVCFDRGRGHEVPVLEAPKKFLRPAETLIDFLFPHMFLDLVDADTSGFISGGGEVEERERYVAKTNPDAGGRTKKASAKDPERLG